MDTTTRSTASSSSTANDNSPRHQGRYSFSSGLTSNRSYDSDNDDDDNTGPYSHSAASNEYGDTPTLYSDTFQLRDVPMEGQHILPSSHDKHQHTNNNNKTIIEFDPDDNSYHSTPLKSNQEYYDVLQMANHRLQTRDVQSVDDMERSAKKKKEKKKSKKGKKSSKKKQQLADAMAKFKEALQRADNDWEYSTNNGDEIESPQISRGMTQRELEDFTIDDTENNGVDTIRGEVPRSSIWKPATLVTVAASKSYGVKIDREGYYKPLHMDKVGSMPKNATTMTTAVGRMYDGASMVYERFQSWFGHNQDPEEMNRDFNLQSLTRRRDTEIIGQSLQSSEEEPRSLQDSIESSRQSSTLGKRPKLQHCDSIVWGDESTIGPAVVDEAENEIEMHDYSYGDINTARKDYQQASELVIEKMKWRRESRLLGCLLFFGGIILMTCAILFIIGNQSESSSSNPSSYSMPPPILIPNNNTSEREDPPPRPDALTPRPIENYNGEMSHPITADDLDFVINRITGDQSILNDPNSPQGKAYAWCKNDLMNYKVNNAARLAQRYSLAVLHYATNGNNGGLWKNSTGWLSGHECSWYGVRCEMGDDKVMYGKLLARECDVAIFVCLVFLLFLDLQFVYLVTYLDLSNNLLDGTIPSELG
jgi:hypothetical protein